MYMKVLSGLLVVALAACSAKKDSGNEVIIRDHSAPEIGIFEAVLSQDHSTVSSHVTRGTDLNVYDDKGYTPLMRAVQTKNAVMVETLIAGGAKIFQPVEGDASISAYKMFDKNETEMVRIFEAERDLLLGGARNPLS